jgi:hypothetical protein
VRILVHYNLCPRRDSNGAPPANKTSVLQQHQQDLCYSAFEISNCIWFQVKNGLNWLRIGKVAGCLNTVMDRLIVS